MNIEKIYEDLTKIIPNSEIKLNEDMSKHTSFKVGGKADVWVKVKTLEDLKNILKYTKENNIHLTVIGNGSNVLVKDNGIRGITISLDFNKIDIDKEKDDVLVNVGSGVKLGALSVLLQKNEIEGFEFASRNSWNRRRSHPPWKKSRSSTSFGIPIV